MAKNSVLYLYSLLSSAVSCSVLCATGPSIADFILVPRLQWLASGANDGISLTILDPFPQLKAVIAKLMALPAVTEYYEKLKK
jgi:glutathione S-transferase